VIADDEDLPLDPALACGPTGRQDGDVVVAGEADRLRM
jgi:hypothetical protein